MQFLNPFYLIGMIAASVPFLIYLWFRRKAKVIEFSSLTFLLESYKRSVRKLQLRQMIILILRTLIIMSIAAAIARPILGGRLAVMTSESATACVIILDNSFSMGYEGIKGRWFDIAKRRALAVVDSLKRGDSASLIIASDRPDVRFPSPTQSLDSVRLEIQEAKLSYGLTDLMRSIAAANAILEQSKEPNKEIYLITDMRRNGWETLRAADIRPRGNLFVLPVGEKNPGNLAVTETRFARQLISVNIPVRLSITVSNFSDTPVDNAIVELSVDGKKRRQIAVSIPPDSKVTRETSFLFPTPGYHRVMARISGDRLPADNERHCCVYVVGGVRTLHVGRKGSYLAYALSPSLGLLDEESPAVILTSLEPDRFGSELGNINLNDYDLLVLESVDGLDISSGARIADYVHNGGRLMLFLGGGETMPDLKYLGDAVPVSVIGMREPPSPIKFGRFDDKHPAFEMFNQAMFSGDESPDFFRVLDFDVADNASVILSFSDGTPAIIERSIDKGMILVINSAPDDTRWNNLSFHPIFLPLVQRLAAYLANPNQQLGTTIGGRIELLLDNTRSVRISNLSDEKWEPLSLPVDADGRLSFDVTDTPGTFRVDTPQGRMLAYVYVNVPGGESDLDEIDYAEASELLSGKARILESSSFGKRDLVGFRRGREVSGLLLALALILMLGETVLSNIGTGRDE